MGIFTRGKVWISADRRTYFEYDPGTNKLGIFVDGVRVGAMSSGAGAAAAATAVAEEYGDGVNNVTKITLTDFLVGTSGDAAALALGDEIYAFPAGDILVESASLIGALTADISVLTDTPEFGLGQEAGAGVVATLGEVSAEAENIAGPFVATSVDGTDVTDGGVSAPDLFIPAADVREVYLNVAVTWANVTAVGAVTFTGVATLRWRKLD